MAISTTQPQVEYLRERIRMAGSPSEVRHYEEQLYRLERMLYDNRYDINTDSYIDANSYSKGYLVSNASISHGTVSIAPSNKSPTIEPPTPLSFLKNADNKLLLTGATS